MTEAAEWVWHPSPVYTAGSHVQRFMDRHGITTFDELHRRSVSDPEWFWDAVVRDLDYQFYRPYTRVMNADAGVPWTAWFEDGTVNVAHNCLDKQVAGPRADRPALVWEGEEGAMVRWTYRDLWQEANRLAHALRTLGVQRGDRVGIFLPMLPETVAAVLACAKLGAIFTPMFSGFAAGAVATRLADCQARVLICADGFYRRGQAVPMKATADDAAAQAGCVERMLVVRRLGCGEVTWQEGRDTWYHDMVPQQPASFDTVATAAHEPLMIIYTSGTTGRPKGAVHVHAGFPLKGAQDMAHCMDLRDSDRLFWLTDLGWMMGPWLIYGSLILGSTMVLYDGAIDYPGPDRLWALAARHGVTTLGLSPTVIRALMAHGEAPVRRHDLSALRILGATGEPWNPEPYLWFHQVVGEGRCPIINYVGGTEISGGYAGCTVLRPIKPCGFNCAIPGMALDVVDEHGNPVRGAVGEVVIRRPWPGMTSGFWNDRQRYLDTYWSRFPDVWVHGDWASVDADGVYFVHGRSDDTIKVAGKRVGPAEVESALVSHPAVQEAAAIGVPHDVKGEAIVAFVILASGRQPSAALRRELETHAAAHLGKALKPDAVKFVTDLPRTRNAKIMRRVVRAAYLGRDPGDLSALESQAAVEAIRQAT